MRRVFWILDGVLCISGGCCAYEECSLGPWESIAINESIIRHVNDILRQENVIFIDFSKNDTPMGVEISLICGEFHEMF